MINPFLNKVLQVPNKKKVSESFVKYDLSYKLKGLYDLSCKLNQSSYDEFNNFLLEYGYKWELTIANKGYSISQDLFKKLQIDQQDDDEVEINFIIYKKGSNILVFDENALYSFISKINLSQVLTSFKDKPFPIKFVYENETIIIGDSEELMKRNFLSSQCNFRNYIQYPFSPNCFYSEELSAKENLSILENTLVKLSVVYSLIYLFDTTEIEEDELKLTISGIKTFNHTLDFNSFDAKSLLEYYKIYQWVYSQKNKIEDKIGIARNIITTYINKDSIKIENSTYNSILSSNRIYVKGNISKYFEVKNKIIEQIESTINKINNSLEMFFNNFQKSVFVFISFFLSIFLFKIVKNTEPSKIFTKETSILGLGLIFLSYLFLLYSVSLLKLDKKRIKERYNNVKSRFKDVLVDEDIEVILNDTSEFDDEMAYFDKRVKFHKRLWIASLILFIVILYITSDYLEVSKIVDFFTPKTS